MKKNPNHPSILDSVELSSSSMKAYKRLQRNDKYPPLLQSCSLTPAAPFKEQSFYRPPSETIGNNYSPSAKNLRIPLLRKHKKLYVQNYLNYEKNRRLKLKSSNFENESRINLRRPFSPLTKKKILEDMEDYHKEKPRKEDIKRYYYYIKFGIHDRMIAPYPFNIMKFSSKLLHPKLKKLPEFNKCLLNLSEEIQEIYIQAMKTSIVNYILLDENERERLKIFSLPKKDIPKTLEAPVPWHDHIMKMKEKFQECYFLSYPTTAALKEMWKIRYSTFCFINIKELEIKYIPLSVSEFISFINNECQNARNYLIERWINDCAYILTIQKNDWAPLVPLRDDGSLKAVECFFSSISATMSRLIYFAVMENLENWIKFIKNYKEGNKFYEDLKQRELNNPSFFIIKAVVKNQMIQFEPELCIIKETVEQFIKQIISAVKNIPRVEKVMFPEMADDELYLLSVDINDINVKKYISKVEKILQKNLIGPDIYLQSYLKYLSLIDGTAVEELNKYFSSNPSIDSLKSKLIDMKKVSEEINNKPSTVYLNLLCLDCSDLNKYLVTQTENLWNSIIHFKLKQNQTHIRKIYDSYDEMSKKLTLEPNNVAELVNLSTYLNQCINVSQFQLLEETKQAWETILFLIDYPILTDADIQMNTKIFNWPSSIIKIFNACKIRIKNQQEQAEQSLIAKQNNFHKNLQNMKLLFDSFKTRENLNISQIENNILELDALQKNLIESKIELEKINEEELLLEWKCTDEPLLATLIEQIQPYSQLWHTAFDFTTKFEKWFNGPFNEINIQEIDEDMKNIENSLIYLKDVFENNSAPKHVYTYLNKKYSEFDKHIPLLKVICNPGMKHRHWTKIGLIIGKTVLPSKKTSLAEMIHLELGNHLSIIEEIASSASKEFSFETIMNNMKNEWNSLKLELIPYQDSDIKILPPCEEIHALLDEHILKIQTISGSPFAKPLKKEIKDWETSLLLIQDVLDAWLKCQSSWMYLEPIFSSEDIMRQMPEEAHKFLIVNEIQSKITTELEARQNLLSSVCSEETLEQLNQANYYLNDIQRGLNEYLQKKRMQFPRFFFISNDELLEILSETNEPQRVQPHLKKCFEGIARLKFLDEDEIVGIISSENEVVPFSQHIFPEQARGMVERWVAEIEKVMMKSLRDIIEKALDAYNKSSETQWLLQWPAQVVICCILIFWTADVTDAIKKGTLKECSIKYNEKMKTVINLKNENLAFKHKVTLETLIGTILYVYKILQKLEVENVYDIQDFNWIIQLRYYWINENVKIMMMNESILYGYEYLGSYSRLVMTPLTERCYRTLFIALNLNLGVSLYGPNSSGKTETCKDIAKTVAKKCVVFSCSEGLTIAAIGNLFKGIVQIGAWLCLEQFNEIELHILSVIAQKIHSVLNAINQQSKFFKFDGIDLNLNPTCGILTTINSHSFKQKELPNNLKQMFRSIALIAPDYHYICENFLLTIGFLEAKKLTAKIMATFKLCKEQFSIQKHYDFSLVSLKSILYLIKNLKEKHPKESDDAIILNAIDYIFIPKLLEMDISLYRAIIDDIFPINTKLNVKYDILERALLHCIKEQNLQPISYFIQKIIQLYELLLIKKGIIITGKCMAGKTSSYKLLGVALEHVNNEEPECGMTEFKVIYQNINPNSVTLNQLYGSTDGISSEWKDGIIPTLLRDYINSKSPERKWIIFDGPLDSNWAENLNTFLDDNEKLCLINGEVIQANNKINVLFETEDLDNASPATISRCGMIYMDSLQLGWKALKESYMKTLPNFINEDHKLIINDLFEWLVPACIEFNQKINSHVVEYSDFHLIQSLMNLYKCLLTEFITENTNYIAILTQLNKHLQILFSFSIVWSFGGIFINDDRIRFDDFYRNLLNEENDNYPKPESFNLTKTELFPEEGLVYDFVYNEEKCNWNMWNSLKNLEIETSTDREIINKIVPTNKAKCQQYFLQKFISHNIPVLLIGPTCSGKTCVTNDYLHKLTKDKYIINWITFSAYTTSNEIQDIFMSKLDRRRKGVFGPRVGKTFIMFIDDINLPDKQQYIMKSPIELLHQWLNCGYWYDQNFSAIEIIDIHLLSAMRPIQPYFNTISSCFIRHMNILTLDTYGEEDLINIFNTIIDCQFNQYASEIRDLRKAIILATKSVYLSVINAFSPIPMKCHYVFNLREFSRVLQGIFLVPSFCLHDSNKLVHLWIHEMYRVFHDKLVDDVDRNMFFNFMKDSAYFEFGEKLENKQISNLLFGDYMIKDNDQKIYDEIVDYQTVISFLERFIEKFNKNSKNPMNLIIFKFVVEHFSRICRVLAMTKGHLLLIGSKGSGRKSIARLSSFVENNELHEIKITSDYSYSKWKNDLKKVIYKAGAEGSSSTLLLDCDDLQKKSFLNDINMVLSTGDIPNLFGSDEKAEILERIQSAVKDKRLKSNLSSSSSPYELFVEQINQNLHIITLMSLTGKFFRSYFRMFPSFITCCTMDWFQVWPEEGLDIIAEKLLQDVKIESEIYSSCIQLCKYFHQDNYNIVEQYRLCTGQYVYTGSTKYIELILTFKHLLGKKQEQLTMFRNRYLMGLERLNFAASQISVMQNELTSLQPQLIETSGETEKLMVKIEQDTVEVEAKKEVVAADEALANKAAASAQAIKDECVKDLSEAVPAMESAVAALNTLKPQDITVIKSMKNPPHRIKMVMEAICIMKEVKPIQKVDHYGKIVNDYWTAAQKMLLGDMKFIHHLQYYNKDDIPFHIMKEIRERFIQNPEFDPDTIKNVSLACEGLCRWVKAIDIYDRVTKVVAPKKAKLALAEKELVRQMKKLEKKKKELQNITDKLQGLNDEFAAMTKKKKELEDNIELCSKKLERAERLLGGLGGERKHWEEIAEKLLTRHNNIVVDILLSAALTVYLGSYKEEFRKQYIKRWHMECIKRSVPCSECFSTVTTLGDSKQILSWESLSLPLDDFTIENCIIITFALKWCLIIDPHGQARKWIELTEKNLKIVRLTDTDFISKFKKALKKGLPILLENVDKTIDPILNPILSKQTFKTSEGEFIQLGDDIIEYSSKFKLYITTNLYNPSYSASIQSKITLLNFTSTKAGIENHLLNIVVAKERPELDKEKMDLLMKSAENEKKLKELEDRILEILSSSQGNILEDETTIRILSSSKTLSEEIITKQKAAAVTQKEISSQYNSYIPIASHATIVFFCVSDLALVNPMYRFSFEWFLHLYIESINESRKTEVLDERIENLNTCFMESVYNNICPSLFDKDKLLFSFLLCIRIMEKRGLIDKSKLNFLLNNKTSTSLKCDSLSWLPNKSLGQFNLASTLVGFEDLLEDLHQQSNSWKKMYHSPTLQQTNFPGKWGTKNGLDKLILLKCLGYDRLLFGIKDLIVENLGNKFICPTLTDLQDLCTSCKKPIVIILSKASDIETTIFRLKEKQNNDCKLGFVSLGNDQECYIEKSLHEAMRTNCWLVLENCHIIPNWMPILERICEELRISEDVHKNFRLWLTSLSFAKFPVSILLNATKVADEIPSNLRGNLLHTYANSSMDISELQLKTCKKQDDWWKLVFSICFFNAALHERKNYNTVGWNAPYEFEQKDLNISLQQALMQLKEQDDIPWKTIYATVECTYGGHLTNENDLHLLSSLFSTFCNQCAIDENAYRFSIGNVYNFPPKHNFLEHTEAFPSETLPEVLGLHSNALMLRGEWEMTKLFDQLQLIQPSVTIECKDIWTSSAKDIVEDILRKLSKPSNCFLSYSHIANPTLHREIIQYKHLIQTIMSSLNAIIDAATGQTPLTQKIEEAVEKLCNGKIPKLWLNKSYPTMKCLGGFVEDLLLRLDFFQIWLEKNIPNEYWLSAFYFPRSFLIEHLQVYGKTINASIEDLKFQCENLDGEHNKGVCIRGLFMEGARWDENKKLIAECLPKKLFDKLPSIMFRPVLGNSEISTHRYSCPMYLTIDGNKLFNSATDANYIMNIDLPSDQHPDHWIQRGVVLLCQINE